MRFDDDHRGGSLETYTALDADDGIAHMHVTADRIGSGHSLQGLDRRNAVIETFAVEPNELPFLESQRNAARFALLELRGVSLFGQRLARSERLLAAYRRTPDTLVDRIFRLLKSKSTPCERR